MQLLSEFPSTACHLKSYVGDWSMYQSRFHLILNKYQTKQFFSILSLSSTLSQHVHSISVRAYISLTWLVLKFPSSLTQSYWSAAILLITGSWRSKNCMDGVRPTTTFTTYKIQNTNTNKYSSVFNFSFMFYHVLTRLRPLLLCLPFVSVCVFDVNRYWEEYKGR